MILTGQGMACVLFLLANNMWPIYFWGVEGRSPFPSATCGLFPSGVGGGWEPLPLSNMWSISFWGVGGGSSFPSATCGLFPSRGWEVGAPSPQQHVAYFLLGVGGWESLSLKVCTALCEVYSVVSTQHIPIGC